MAARSDGLYRQRKAARQNDLRRSPPTRSKRKRVLIVTEGSLTEPQYFSFMSKALELTSVDVDISGEGDPSPQHVVRYAREKAIAEGSWEQGGYDAVFCVFDRDDHADFHRAVSQIHSLQKSRKFPAKELLACVSVPCFEYWLLLHYCYSRSPFLSTPGSSAFQQIATELKKYTQCYENGKKLSKPLLDELFTNLNLAVTNSKKAAEDAFITGAENPTTQVHLIFDYFDDNLT